jgi:hypothetical protein
MERWLARWLSSLQPQARKRFDRAFGLFAATTIAILLVVFVVLMVQLVSIWVTGWQGAHGHYPTGHLTYAVPEKWDTTTLTNLKSSDVWWGVFDDRVTVISPSYSACYGEDACAANPPHGARVDLESAPGHSLPTIEAWYQNWAVATVGRFGADTILPLADYAHTSLGGQGALCAANQAGSQMLPPHPPPSPHFDTVFSGYTPSYLDQAVVMCFALWQGRVYYMEVTVELHTASRDTDLRDAARLIESLRFS